MDFPLFHLDWLNDRMLIAVIAILHVLINHGLAVGFIPYITLLEQQGVTRSAPDEITNMEWDNLVYRKMKVAFIITTTVGAMTGVGIWLSASLISPTSIGSLIRVFYWAWFVEWLVFVTEVVLILIYFLTWKQANKTLKGKLRHIRFGWFLAVFSWITMAIIVSILGFMMDPGNWHENPSLLNGFTNPIYLPQLLFRTPTAMVVAGIFGMLLSTLFTRKNRELRAVFLRKGAKWLLFWLPASILGAIYYYQAIPEAMTDNMSTAVGTMEFQLYYDTLKYVIIGSASLLVLLIAFTLWKPKKVRGIMVLIPCVIAFGFLGIFERVREFIRKPYVIGGYMYSNLLLEKDYPLYKRDGILPYATYTSVSEITEKNKVEAGKNVFMLTCSRCHTTHGVNSVVYVFKRMYGEKEPLRGSNMAAYISGMHNGRTYMPPFPGNQEELDALGAYIEHISKTHETIEGAQTDGIVVNNRHTLEATIRSFSEKSNKQSDK
jgi:Cytochrome C oxidase, cbb3-type, subunit III